MPISAKLKDWRPSTLLALMALVPGALWLAWIDASLLCAPSRTTAVFKLASYDQPNEENLRLDELQARLAPIDEGLPAHVSLRYLGEHNRNNQFEYFQAVLAPRPIGRAVDSPYLFVYAESWSWLARQAELRNARPIIRLDRLSGIYLKGSSR